MRHFFLVLVLNLAASSTIAQTVWSTYSNPRFGVVVSYPAIFDRRDAPPDNGDGQVFRTRDQSAILTVSGSYSVDALNQTNAEAMASQKEAGVTYSYQQTLPSGFVLSGKRGSRILYVRCVIVRPRIGCVELEYPESDARKWDTIVNRISRSVRLLKQ